MGPTQSNVVGFQQNVTNDIVSSSSATCNATSTSEQINNTIIVLNSEISGDVGVVTVTSVDASCTIGNTMNDTISNSIAAAVQQENSALNGILGGLGNESQSNLIDVTQNIANNVTLLMNSTCQATNTVAQENNLVYLDGSTIGQNVGILNTGGTSYASCTINNLSKLQVYNQMTASASQKNSSVSLLALIFIIVFLCVLVAAIIAIAKIFGKKKTNTANAQTSAFNQQQLDLINQYIKG